MKIIHTSDWHLGQEFYSYDRSEEHESFLRQLCDIIRAEQPDALVVSGDIYHNATPSNAVMRLFTDHLDAIRQACSDMQVVVIAGNHDSASRLEISSAVWKHLGVHIIGRLERDEDGNINFDRHIIPISRKGYIVAIPHIFPQNYPLLEEYTPREERQSHFLQAMNQRLNELNREGWPVVVAAHWAISGSDMTGHDLTRGNMDYTNIHDIAIGFDYLALGHIHCPQNIDNGRARYCGTPIPVSFDENYPHSVSVVTLSASDGKPDIRTISIDNPWPLRTLPKEAVTFDEAMEVLSALPDDRKEYIRLHVKIEQTAPPNAMERAHAILKDKAARFCCFKWQRKEKEGAGNAYTLDVEQIKQLSPIEVAELYFQDEYGEKMEGTLKEMLQEVIKKVEQNNP